MKRANCFALGIFLSLLLLSCGKGSGIQQTKGPLPEKKVSGPILNLSLDATIDTLDQQVSVYATSFELIGNMIDGLMQMADDGSVRYEGFCRWSSLYFYAA